VKLLELAKMGKVLGKSTTAWGAVGGGARGIVSAVQAESLEAHAEMKYLRAADAVGAADWELVRMVCIEGIVPRSISRSRLCNALDNLAEYLNIAEPPATVKRPPMRPVPPRLVRRQS
jgi:hypothetical protein